MKPRIGRDALSYLLGAYLLVWEVPHVSTSAVQILLAGGGLYLVGAPVAALADALRGGNDRPNGGGYYRTNAPPEPPTTERHE